MLNLLDALWQRTGREFEKMRRVLVSVIAVTMITVPLIICLRPSFENCLLIAFIPWFFSGYKLFSIRRYIKLHVTGEMLEFFQVSILAPKADEAGKKTGILENPFIKKYRELIFNIFIAQTALFLILPIYVERMTGGIVSTIAIAMILVIMLIVIPVFVKRVAIFATTIVCLGYCIMFALQLFPEFKFYVNEAGMKDVDLIPQSSAKIANETMQLRAKQREEQKNEILMQEFEWQKAHPGQEPPAKYRDRIRNIGKGGDLQQPVRVAMMEPEKRVVDVTAPERRTAQSVSISSSTPTPSSSSSRISDEGARKMARMINGN